MPDRPYAPRYRDAERARNTAHLGAGPTVLFMVVAVLQWLADDDPWIQLLDTAMAVGHATNAWQFRRRAREAAARAAAGGFRDPGVRPSPS